MTQFSFFPSGEARELTADIRELFDDLAATLHQERRAFSGECHPTIDVFETDEAVEIVVDVCGIAPEALRVLFRKDVLIIAGEKAPARPGEGHTFHLVEREFGRFARAVRLGGSYDVPKASAQVRDGELVVVLPKLVDRRGQSHLIPVTRGEGPG